MKGRSLQEYIDFWRRQAKLCQRSCNILPPPFFTFTLVSSELESITNTVSGCGCDRQCYDLLFINCQVLTTASKGITNIVAVLIIKTLIEAILTLLSLQFQLEPPTPTCDGITGVSVQQQQQRWPAGGKVVQQHSSSQVAFLPVDELVACTLRPAWCTHKHRLALCFQCKLLRGAGCSSSVLGSWH